MFPSIRGICYPLFMIDVQRKKVKHFNYTGHAHELTFSCYKRFPLLSRDRTREWLIEAIDKARKERGFSVFAYVIMPEHVHIIVSSSKDEYDISWFLKSVKQSVSRRASHWLIEHDPVWYSKLCVVGKNRKKVFRFWQPGGGYDRNITKYATLLEMINYIHHNPVRRGLADNPVTWKWSSSSWYEDGEGVLCIDPLPE